MMYFFPARKKRNTENKRKREIQIGKKRKRRT